MQKGGLEEDVAASPDAFHGDCLRKSNL